MNALKQAGLKDPLEKWDEYDRQKAQQLRDRAAERDRSYNEFTGHEPTEPEAALTLREQTERARQEIARQNYQGESF